MFATIRGLSLQALRRYKWLGASSHDSSWRGLSSKRLPIACGEHAA